MLALPAVVAALCAWALAVVGDRSLRRWREAREREAGVAVARGRLVVVGDGCVEGERPRGARGDAKLAASTSWIGPSRTGCAAMTARSSTRAATIKLAADDGEIAIAGTIEVVGGTVVRWALGRDDVGADFVRTIALRDGDLVRAFGRVVENEGAAPGEPARRLERADVSGVIRLVSEQSPRISRVGHLRQPAVLLAALLCAWLSFGAVRSFRRALEDPDGACQAYGVCHPVPTWRSGAVGKALKGWLAGDHFVRGPATDVDCRASNACVLTGACSLVNGACGAARDEDCRASWYCMQIGSCSSL
jgi:hypothetical protein